MMFVKLLVLFVLVFEPAQPVLRHDLRLLGGHLRLLFR